MFILKETRSEYFFKLELEVVVTDIYSIDFKYKDMVAVKYEPETEMVSIYSKDLEEGHMDDIAETEQ